MKGEEEYGDEVRLTSEARNVWLVRIPPSVSRVWQVSSEKPPLLLFQSTQLYFIAITQLHQSSLPVHQITYYFNTKQRLSRM